MSLTSTSALSHRLKSLSPDSLAAITSNLTQGDYEERRNESVRVNLGGEVFLVVSSFLDGFDRDFDRWNEGDLVHLVKNDNYLWERVGKSSSWANNGARRGREGWSK